MRHLFQKLIHKGIYTELSYQEQNKVRIFNTFSLVLSIVLVGYEFVWLFLDYYLAFIFCAVELIIILTGFLLSSHRKYRLAFHLEMVGGISFLMVLSFLFGSSAQSHLYLFLFPVLAIIQFDSYRAITFYSLLSTIMFIISQLLFKYNLPYYESTALIETFGYFNPMLTSLLIYFGIKQFKIDNLNFAKTINLQRLQLEEKNKGITDSIQYAKRIQRALLAPEPLLKKNLPNHFVLYKPKDIVSGDFYWAAEINNKNENTNSIQSSFLLCVGDCTGHGVPGAFMSLLGVSFLNEIALRRTITQPNEIFNQLREEIIKAINPEGIQEEGKDGMDAVLCNFNFQKMEMRFACANNTTWLIRDNEVKVFEADNFPIGMYEGEMRPFTAQTVQLMKDDVIYFCTDGYADQFGGSKGKKLRKKKLLEKLVTVSNKPLSEQKLILENFFDDWKGNLDQVDDVLLIGIKI